MAVIAKSIDIRMNPGELHSLHGCLLQKVDIFVPYKITISRIFSQIIMVSRDQDYLCILYRGKQIIHFFKLPQKRLPMKQVPGNQKKICLPPARLLNHLAKGLPDLLVSPCTPRISLIRLGPQMYISQMYKTHGSLLSYQPSIPVTFISHSFSPFSGTESHLSLIHI